MAYLDSYRGFNNVFIKRSIYEEGFRLTQDTLRDIHRFMWANENLLLYLQDRQGDENFQLFGMDLKIGQIYNLDFRIWILDLRTYCRATQLAAKVINQQSKFQNPKSAHSALRYSGFSGTLPSRASSISRRVASFSFGNLALIGR